MGRCALPLTRLIATSLLGLASIAFAAPAVVAHVDYVGGDKARAHAKEKRPEAIVWLTPVEPASAEKAPLQPPAPGAFTMAQHDKMFSPHLLVMPVGSSVSFPNRDPFFHNVFSFFNGRRFDLGLYQSGQTRSVVFNRVGISYIFCNIHPEMSAIIITLDTPYFGVADETGAIHIDGVPPGAYTLHVWSEEIPPEAKQPAGRRVTIAADADTDLGSIPIHIAPGTLSEHLNKFGQPYDTHVSPAY
jgi:plastocyanin